MTKRKLIFIKEKIILALLLIIGVYCHILTIQVMNIKEVQKKNEQKYHDFYNIEMVLDKPEFEYIVYPKIVSLYTEQFEKFGEILDIPIVYSYKNKEASVDSLLQVTIYGWVWKESLDSCNQLKTDENIRYWSNSHIIARLNAEVHLDTIYTNEKKSWTLVTIEGLIPISNLLSNEEFMTIPKWKRFTSNQNVKRTVTKRYAGRAMQPTTRPLFSSQDLKWQFSLLFSYVFFMLVIGILLRWYIPSGIKNKKRRLIRAIIAFSAGLVLGSIYWF